MDYEFKIGSAFKKDKPMILGDYIFK